MDEHWPTVNVSIAGTARFDEDEHGACPQATVARQHHELLRSVAHEEASAPAARRAGLRDCRFPCSLPAK